MELYSGLLVVQGLSQFPNRVRAKACYRRAVLHRGYLYQVGSEVGGGWRDEYVAGSAVNGGGCEIGV